VKGALDHAKEVNRMFDFMRSYFLAMREREEGQALVEYALILALISVVSIAILTTLGGQIETVLQSVSAAF
jgi:pilus assembly protein Flp/PilA